jgi:hypothetical protein
VGLCPREMRSHLHPPNPDGDLRLVARPLYASRRMPWYHTTPAGQEPIRSAHGFGLGPFSSSEAA